LERERHELESLLSLLRGITAHEQANAYHDKDWQKTLNQLTGDDAQPFDKRVKLLTREEVMRHFDAFPAKKALLDAEQQALEQYQRLLDLDTESIQVRETTSIHRTDIEVLVNDIRARVFERIPDASERRAALEALDAELADIIHRI